MMRTTFLMLGLGLAVGCSSNSTATDIVLDAATPTDTATGTDVVSTTDSGNPSTDTPAATDTPVATDTPAATDAPAGATGTLMGHAVDATMSPTMGLAGVTIKTCAASDLSCASPFATTTTTGSSGAFTITYPLTGGVFTGYLQFTAGTTEAITPTRTFIQLGATSTADFPLVAMATFSAASLLSPTIMFGSTYGAVTYNVLTAGPDGGSSAVSGVSVSVSPSPTGLVPFYVMNGSPFPSITATMTDASGEGGFFTVMPGNYTFTAHMGSTTLGTVTASVAAGFITAFTL